MTEVIRLESFRNSKLRSHPSLSDGDMMVKLMNLRRTAALLESDLAKVKQRLLEELVEHQEKRENV